MAKELLNFGHCLQCPVMMNAGLTARDWILERVDARREELNGTLPNDLNLKEVIVTSDNHLDFSPSEDPTPPGGIGRRKQDFSCAMCHVVRDVMRRKPRAFIQAGDVFETPRPSNYAIGILGDFLYIASLFSEVFMIDGNHVAPAQSSTKPILYAYAKMENVNIVCDGKPGEFRRGDMRIAMVPHVITQPRFEELLQAQEPDEEVPYNLLVTHGMVLRKAPVIDEGGTTRYINEAHITEGFDVTILGDVHEKWVGPRMFYPGSAEKQDIDEAAESKCFVRVSLPRLKGDDFQKALTFVPVPNRQMIDYPILDLSEITDPMETQSQIIAAMQAQDITGKVVRLQVKGIDDGAYKALDWSRIDEIRTQALIFNLKFIGTVQTESLAGGLDLSTMEDLSLEFPKFMATSGIEGEDLEGVLWLYAEALRTVRAKSAEEEAKAQ